MIVIPGMVGLTLAVIAGYAWLYPLTNMSRTLRLGFAYGVGLTWVSLAMAALAGIGVPLVPWVGVPAVMGPPLVMRWVAWRRGGGGVRGAPKGQGDRSRDMRWLVLLAIVGIVWGIVAVRATIKPLSVGDAWSTYGFKAKAIFVERSISELVLRAVEPANYPLAVPLQEVWISWMAGAWNDWAVKLLYPGYLLAMILLVYGFLKEYVAPWIAMAGGLFVESLPLVLQHAQEGYADLPFAYLVVASSVALSRYAVLSEDAYLIVGGLCTAGAIWTREDGGVIFGTQTVLLVVFTVRRFGFRFWSLRHTLLLYGAFPIMVWGVWFLTKLALGLSSNLTVYAGDLSFIVRLKSTIVAYLLALYVYGNWLILWVLVPFTISYLGRRSLKWDSLFLLWPVAIYLGFVAVVSIGTELFQFVNANTVLSRLILHVAPLAALWVALEWGRFYGDLHSHERTETMNPAVGETI